MMDDRVEHDGGVETAHLAGIGGKGMTLVRDLMFNSRRCTQSDVLSVVCTFELQRSNEDELLSDNLSSALAPSGVSHSLREITYKSPLLNDVRVSNNSESKADDLADLPLLREESAFMAKLDLRRQARVTQERVAACRIQRMARGWLMRQWLKRNAGKLRLQRKMKRSYQMINKQVRLRMEMQENAKRIEENRERASIKVQSVCRMHLAKRAVRKERFVSLIERLNTSATAINAVVRGYLGRKCKNNIAERYSSERLLRAALCVQSIFRMWVYGKRVVSRRVYTRRHAAASTIQRSWRCFVARQVLNDEKAMQIVETRHGAALSIQALVRGVQTRARISVIMSDRQHRLSAAAALSIQAVARGWLYGRSVARYIRWTRASVMRSYAAIHMQRVVRGFIARRRSSSSRERLATDIFVQARLGHKVAVEDLHAVQSCKFALDINGDSVFTIACKTGNMKLAMRSLRWGLDCDHVNDMGYTGVMCATRNGYVDLALFLLSSFKCSPEGFPGGKTLLHAACEAGQLAVVQAVLELPAPEPLVSASPSTVEGEEVLEAEGSLSDSALLKPSLGYIHRRDSSKRGRSPIHEAVCAKRNTVELVELLVKAGADPNAADDDGVTPLHLAAELDNVQVAELLLQLGANPKAENALQQTPWTSAIYKHKRGCAKLLKSGWQHVNSDHDDDFTDTEETQRFLDVPESLIDLVRLKGDRVLAKVKQALESGFPAYATDGTGKTLLMMAAYSGAVGIAELCMDSIHILDDRGQSALHYAVFNVDSTRLFLAQPVGSSMMTAPDKEGVTPLHLAAGAQHDDLAPEICKLVQSARIQLDNVIDHGGNTPLHYAAFEGCVSGNVVSRLVKLGASIRVQNIIGDTALHHMATNPSIESDCAECCEIFKPVANTVNSKGQTPLHLAVQTGSEKLALYLARIANSTVTMASDDGKTPLHIAVQNAHTKPGAARYTHVLNLLKCACAGGDEKLLSSTGTGILVAAIESAPGEAAQSTGYLDFFKALMNALGDTRELPESSLGPVLLAAISAKQYKVVEHLLQLQPSCLCDHDQVRRAIEVGSDEIFSLLEAMRPQFVALIDIAELVATCAHSTLADNVILFDKLAGRLEQINQYLPSLVLCACMAGNVKILQSLVARDPALINGQYGTANGTPLHAAAMHGRKEVIRWLLQNNADPTIKDGEGSTPMMVSKDASTLEAFA